MIREMFEKLRVEMFKKRETMGEKWEKRIIEVKVRMERMEEGLEELKKRIGEEKEKEKSQSSDSMSMRKTVTELVEMDMRTVEQLA